MLRLVLIGALLCSASTSVHAQEADVEGCKDLKVLKRYPAATIYNCEAKEYDEVDVPVSVDADANPVQKKVGGKTQLVEYKLPENLSEIQVGKNIENALSKAGFKILVGARSLPSCCTITAQLKDVYVTASVGGGSYSVREIDVKEMDQKMEADASTLAEELNKSGRVAVYGINFETGKATITPDSDKVLEQVARLLKDNAEMKLRIEGHTDNSGKAKENLELSKKRAAAVKAWLVKNGVDGARLKTEGFGSSKPAADNSTDEGKAKNRRVELVKI